jgi:dihydroneopterin aldolase
MISCSIALRDVQLLADIGVYHHEIGRPQPLILHVVLAVTPPERDSVEDVFDYVRIKRIAEALSRERIVLIETFARRVAEACLDHQLVLGAVVTVEKPQGVPGSMASATVRIGEPVA